MTWIQSQKSLYIPSSRKSGIDKSFSLLRVPTNVYFLLRHSRLTEGQSKNRGSRVEYEERFWWDFADRCGFSFSFLSFSVLCKRSWKLKKKKSSPPMGAPLSHRKHYSWNASSVALPLIRWPLDITASSCYTFQWFYACIQGVKLTGRWKHSRAGQRHAVWRLLSLIITKNEN